MGTGRPHLVRGSVRVMVIAFVSLLLVGCNGSPTARGRGPAASPVRLMFLGDVMLGRGVAPVVAAAPNTVFEQLRPALIDADLVLANLESPLTNRSHTAAGFALEADPASASLLASAGIDVVDLANNHAMDAGPATAADTMSAVHAVGLRSVGAGVDDEAAAAPLIEHVGGVRVGILAFDMAGGTAAGETIAGVNFWDPAGAERAVKSLRARVDLVVVGLHGGVEYLPRPDPVLERVVEQLRTWGADVVWGHGAHVPYPVRLSNDARPVVIAPGLGNALFDQRLPGTTSGTALEVMADVTGVLAIRAGTVTIEAGRSVFSGWNEPAGDAVAIRTQWWTPARPVTLASSPGCATLDIASITKALRGPSTVLAHDCGRITGTGRDEAVMAYRRPGSEEVLQGVFPGRRWMDAEGRSAHLAVMEPDGRMRWGAATLFDPIGSVAACSGALALGLTTLDDQTVVAASVWTWTGFGFQTAPTLTNPTSIGCADIDHDGSTEPVVLRSAP